MTLPPGYDRWRTGGDYHEHEEVWTCAKCGDEVHVTIANEYGRAYLTPEECPGCGHELGDDDIDDEGGTDE